MRYRATEISAAANVELHYGRYQFTADRYRNSLLLLLLSVLSVTHFVASLQSQSAASRRNSLASAAV